MESENPKQLFTFRYTYVETVTDTIEFEAETLEAAEEEFEQETNDLDDVEIQSVYSRAAPPYVDPNQLEMKL